MVIFNMECDKLMAHWMRAGNEIRVYTTWYEEFDYRDFNSKEEYIAYLKKKHVHKGVLDTLINFITKQNSIKKDSIKRVIEFGCGLGGYPYVLSKQFPHIRFDAVDYDKNCIEAITHFLPKIHTGIFDFKKNKVNILGKFQMAFMVSSAYAMNNKQFVSFFKDLYQNNVEWVIDFSGGVIEGQNIGGGVSIDNHVYGYGNTVESYKEMYKKSGYTLIGSRYTNIKNGTARIFTAVLHKGMKK